MKDDELPRVGPGQIAEAGISWERTVPSKRALLWNRTVRSVESTRLALSTSLALLDRSFATLDLPVHELPPRLPEKASP